MNNCFRPKFERICPKQFNPSSSCNLCAVWDKKERFEYLWLGGWLVDFIPAIKTGLRDRGVNWCLNACGLISNFLGASALILYGSFSIDSKGLPSWVYIVGLILLALGFLLQLIGHIRRDTP
jgi:hypothetical protein